MSTALYDMLGGISKGQHCSELSYNFMVRGGEVILGSAVSMSSGMAHCDAGLTVSWNTIFKQLEAWVTPAANPHLNQVQAPSAGLSMPCWNQYPQASQQLLQQITLGC